MAQTYLIFDFGADEESAQQARHRLEGWRQAFRLSGKLQLKFDRQAPEKDGDKGNIRVLVCLGFSDHEKLSHQRWLERIPAEEPFKTVKAQVIRSGDAAYPQTVETFEALN